MPSAPPRAPFADWPIQRETPHGYVWYTDPGVMITQAHITHADLASVLPMSEDTETLFQLKRDELAKLGGLLIIHDWRTVKSYDSDTRKHLIKRVQDRQRGLVRGVIIAVSLNPFLRAAVQVASAIMSATTGARLQMVDSLSPALIENRVQVPAPSARFPGT
jgi:hypothetical protein